MILFERCATGGGDTVNILCKSYIHVRGKRDDPQLTFHLWVPAAFHLVVLYRSYAIPPAAVTSL